MRLHAPLNSFTGLTPGGTSSVEVPRSRRYHAFFLFSGSDNQATLAAKIKEIRIVTGGRQLHRYNTDQLIALNAYRGLAFNNGELPIYFSDPTSRTPVGEEASAFNTFNLTQPLYIEIDWWDNNSYNTALSTTGGFTPAIVGTLEFDLVNDGNRAFITRIPATVQPSGSGDYDWNTLPRVGAYKALHLFTTNVTRVQVTRDDVGIMDRTPAIIAAIGRRNSLTPQSGHLPIDFAFTNQATDALEMTVSDPTVQSGTRPADTFNVKLTFSSGGAVKAIVEQILPV